MAQASDTLQVLATPSPQISGKESLCPLTTGEIYYTDSISGHTYLWSLDAPDASIVSGQGTHRITVNWGNSSGNLSVRESDPVSGCDSTTALFPVFVGDDQGPAMGCLEDLTIELDTSCTFSLPDYRSLLNPIDECDGSVLVEQTPPAGTVLAGSGTQQEITIRAEDQSGNETQCSFSVSLMDVAAPKAEYLADTSIILPEGIYETEVSPAPPQFSDNCGILSVSNDFNGGGLDASGVYPFGTTVVQFTVSDINGNVSIFEQRVSLEYENAPDFGLIIPEGISPNNDGFNDQFRILGLEAYPANRLEIFNVHGIRVYSQESYDHSWEGTSMHGKQKHLPSGTYYYVLYLDQEGAILKGFIYLRRE
jgi:gliding motility-associated-like protein